MAYRIGVIGGGQLARMMVPPAVELGIEIRVLAEAEGSPAAIAATAVGDYHDADDGARLRARTSTSSPSTTSTSRRPCSRARRGGRRRAPGPGRAGRRAGQDRHARAARRARRCPCPTWARRPRRRRARRLPRRARRPGRREDRRAAATTARACASCARPTRPTTGSPRSPSTAAAARCSSRSSSSSAASSRSSSPGGRPARSSRWPLVETVQRDGVCAEVIAPAPGRAGRSPTMADDIAPTVAERARRHRRARRRAVRDRPTTGCWSTSWRCARTTPGTGRIDGAVTSQFEQHLRAVLDLPLGDTGADRRLERHGQRARRPGAGHDAPTATRRAGRPARRQGPRLRQGAAPGPQGRARHGAPATTSTTSSARARAAAAFFED